MPKHGFLLGSELEVGGEYRKASRSEPPLELVAPLAHLLAPPAHDGAVVDAQTRVGHYETLVDAHGSAKPLAGGARSHRRVEREHHVGGLLECQAVGLEAVAEFVEHAAGVKAQETGAVALVESRFDTVAEAVEEARLRTHSQAVDHKADATGLDKRLLFGLGALQEFVDGLHRSVYVDARSALLPQQQQLVGHRAVGPAHERRQQREARARGIGQREPDHVLDALLLDLKARYGRDGLAHPRIEHAQIVVDAGSRAHGGARIAGGDLLLDGNGRRKMANEVDFRLLHTA